MPAFHHIGYRKMMKLTIIHQSDTVTHTKCHIQFMG